MSRPAVALTATPQRFGRYVLLEPLGRGGMAEVWRARVEGSAGFAREVVIKRILSGGHPDADLTSMFAREAKVLSLLRHANIIQVLDYGDVAGEPFLAMEYVEGLDVHRLLRRAKQRGQSIAPGIAAYIAREMARALRHVHEAKGEDGEPAGLVHRDVSPSNVMLSLDGSVKLLDFGIAKSRADRLLTGMGAFRGKVGYSAPEVIEGNPHEPRSDLFALGVVLHELLTGQRLFDAPSDMETFGLVRAAQVRSPSELAVAVPAALDAVCLTALARLPGDRYDSAQAFLAAIDPVVHELQTGSEQLAAVVAGFIEPHERSRATGTLDVQLPETATRAPLAQRSRVPVVLGAVGLVAALGVAAALTLGRHVEPPPLRAVAPSAVAERPAPEPVNEPKQQPQPAARVHVELRTVPAGATVKSPAGALLGETPFDRSWVSGEQPARLVLERPGYVRAMLELPASGEVEQVVTLKRAPAKKGRGGKVDLKGGGVVDPFH